MQLPLSDAKNYEVYDAFFDSLTREEQIFATQFGMRWSSQMMDNLFRPHLRPPTTRPF